MHIHTFVVNDIHCTVGACSLFWLFLATPCMVWLIINICMCTCVYVCVRVCVCVCMCVCVYVCVCVHYVCMLLNRRLLMSYIYTCMYMYCVCICVCMRVCVCVNCWGGGGDRQYNGKGLTSSLPPPPPPPPSW